MTSASRCKFVLFCLLLAVVQWLGTSDALAQPASKLPRIGFLLSGAVGQQRASELARILNRLGYVNGTTAIFDFKVANVSADLPRLATELVNDDVAVIVAHTNVTAFVAKATTSRVPIVVFSAHDAVGTGLVNDLAHPGGNITGIDTLAPELDARRLLLLRELVPNVKTLVLLYNPDDQGAPIHLRLLDEASSSAGLSIRRLPLRRTEDLEATLQGLAVDPTTTALLTLTDPVTAAWKGTAAYAAQMRIPTACEYRFLVEIGCLFSYGPRQSDIQEVVARKVDQILKGAKPGDLPFERVSRFELVLNMRTVTRLGLTVPQAVQASVDDVIQ